MQTGACRHLPPPQPQDWGIPKFDPFSAAAGWAATPTLTRWQQFALVGQYDRFDPVAQLLQAAKQASSQPAPHSKYCPVSSLLSLLHGGRQAGTAAAAPAAPAPVFDTAASSSDSEPADQHSRLLAALARAAAQPGMQVSWPASGWEDRDGVRISWGLPGLHWALVRCISRTHVTPDEMMQFDTAQPSHQPVPTCHPHHTQLTRQYDGIRALLAAAPPPGEARANFVHSLVSRGLRCCTAAKLVDLVDGWARRHTAGGECACSLCASSCRPVPASACCPAIPRQHRALPCPHVHPLQLDGIAAAAESGDGASVFGQAGVLLEMALEEEPALLKDAADKYDRLLDALAAEAEVSHREGQGATCKCCDAAG